MMILKKEYFRELISLKMFNWEQSTFSFIIGVSGLIVLLISFSGKTYDGRRKWYSKLTKKGWYASIAFIISIAASVFKDQQAKKDQIIQQKRDSLQRIKDNYYYHQLNDQSNSKIVGTIAEALAKSDLKYDTAENKIKRLVRDSSKKTILNNYGNSPELGVRQIVLKKTTTDTLDFDITISATQSNAHHINMRCLMIIDEQGQSLYLVNRQPLLNKITDANIPIDNPTVINLVTFGHPKNKNALKIDFYLVGTYKDLRNKSFKYVGFFTYYTEYNRFGETTSSDRSRVTQFLKDKGVY